MIENIRMDGVRQSDRDKLFAQASGDEGAAGASKVQCAIEQAQALLEKASHDINVTVAAGEASVAVNLQDSLPVLEEPEEKIKSGGPKFDKKSLNGLLEELIANLKIDTDEQAARQAEKRIDTEKGALRKSHNEMHAAIAKNVEAMRAAAKQKTLMKVVSWVMVGLAVVMAAAMAAVAIAASIAAGMAAALTAGTSVTGIAAAAGGAAGGAAAGAGALAEGAAVGASTAISGGVTATATANGFSLSVTTGATATGAAKVSTTALSGIVANAMTNVASTKAIVGTLSTIPLSLTMQTLNETGVMEKLQESIASRLRAQGVKDADLVAQIIVGVATMASMVAPGLMGGTLGMGVMAALGATLTSVLNYGMVGMGGVMLIFTTTQQGVTIEAQFEAGMAEADVTEVKALIQLLQQMLDEAVEELEEIMAKIQNALGMTFDIIASSLDASKEITEKTGQMQA